MYLPLEMHYQSCYEIERKADCKLDLPCFGIGSWKCMRVDSLNYNIGLLNGVDC